MKKIFAIVGKRPIPDFSKTRLAESVGNDFADQLYRAFIQDFFRNLATSKFNEETIWFFGTPAEEETKKYFQIFGDKFEKYHYFHQEDVAFFERLKNIFNQADPQDIIYLTGTDLPDFPFNKIQDLSIDDGEFVIGPDPDGGFYFLAAKAKYAELFDIDHLVKDGMDSVFETILARGKELELTPMIIDEWSDIDTLSDLKEFKTRNTKLTCPYTFELLTKLDLFT